ncbi:MAG: AMP-binding protein [Deltaproteobacteria bacterium]|nr:AMP-binding protein [Deltaproteobacteria bacterium]
MAQARLPAVRQRANLTDYAAARREFSWDEAVRVFDWAANGRCNLLHEAMDRRIADPGFARRPALVLLGPEGAATYTYAQLAQASCRWARIFDQAGLAPGDVIFLVLEPAAGATQFEALAGALRAGLVPCLWRAGLSDHLLAAVLERDRPRALVTTRRAAVGLPPQAWDGVEQVIWWAEAGPVPGLTLTPEAVSAQEAARPVTWRKPDDPLYLTHAAGQDGPPRAVVHPQRAMLGLYYSAHYALDLSERDTILVAGHPASALVTLYGALAPWLLGGTGVVPLTPLAPRDFIPTLARQKVNVLYTSPPVLDQLMDELGEPEEPADLPHLKFVATVGRALNLEEFFWVRKALDRPPHENWWTVETGMITLANLAVLPLKQGSIGVPLPGVNAQVVDQAGEPRRLLTQGELALCPSWPSLPRDLAGAPLAPREACPGWWRSGDYAFTDEEGFFFLQGRGDDLVRGQGRMISPWEVESLARQLPLVREAAAVAAVGERPGLHLYVTLAPGAAFTPETHGALTQWLTNRLAPDVHLAAITMLPELPRNQAGRVIRRALRALDLGLPPGDVHLLPPS